MKSVVPVVLFTGWEIMPDTSLGIYTYCLTGSPVSFPCAVMGIDGIHETHFIDQDGLFAVVSAIFLKDFSEDTLEKNMTDVAWLAPLAKRHEEVIEFVMTHNPADRSGNTPVVPLRFCTIYKNQEALFQAVTPHREKILHFLEYTSNKAEWAVKIFCDKKTFMDGQDKKISGDTREPASLLPGENYLLAKKMRRIREETFTVDIQRILNDIHSAISPHVDSHRFLRCTDKSIHGRPFDMVMNTAFLVEQQTLPVFQDVVDTLAEKYKEHGFVFELSGPWPPYNFCPEL